MDNYDVFTALNKRLHDLGRPSDERLYTLSVGDAVDCIVAEMGEKALALSDGQLSEVVDGVKKAFDTIPWGEIGRIGVSDTVADLSEVA